MKKFLATALLCSLTTPFLFAQDQDTEYQIVAYKDCQLVYQKKLTPQQTDAYLQIKKYEDKFDVEEVALKDFESKMSELGEKMKTISAKAYIENGETITINKAFMREQEAIADQIQSVVSEYQPVIDKVESYGDQLSEAANAFESSLPEHITDGAHNFVRIIEASKTPEQRYCHDDMHFSYVH